MDANKHKTKHERMLVLIKQLKEPYRSPRNLAAGSVRKLDAVEAGKRHLEFFAFDLVTEMAMDTKHEQLAFLEENGFTVVPYLSLPSVSPDALNNAVKQANPKDFGYPADGLILEYDDIAYGNRPSRKSPDCSEVGR